MHFLDLPNLHTRPSSSELLEALTELEPGETKGFELAEPLDKNIRQWLSRLTLADLSWIEDESLVELIREKASRRLGLECGVTAVGNRIRAIDLPGLGSVKLLEPGITEDNLGLLTWGASFILARRISLNLLDLRGATVLELGAGTGLCGIAAAKLGVDVDLTDLPEIVPNLQNNVELNNLKAKTFVFDWTNPPALNRQYDTVLVSDPLYSKEHPKFLLTALNHVKADVVHLEIPLRELFVAEREELYTGLASLGYTRTEYCVEDGTDLFGNAQQFAYSKWVTRP